MPTAQMGLRLMDSIGNTEKPRLNLCCCRWAEYRTHGISGHGSKLTIRLAEEHNCDESDDTQTHKPATQPLTSGLSLLLLRHFLLQLLLQLDGLRLQLLWWWPFGLVLLRLHLNRLW